MKLIGLYEDRKRDSSEGTLPDHMLGKVSDELELDRLGKLQHVYIAMQMHAKDRIARYWNQFAYTTTTTYFLPFFFSYNLLHIRFQTLFLVHTLIFHDTPFIVISALAHLLASLFLSIIILLLFSPFFLFFAIAVFLSSSAPFLFIQPRFCLFFSTINVL
ncbi:hypothetical protein [Grimontia marina]|uniref:UDP-glucose:undecaprenyl-phosphate glucose-1-phosphate transferase n=1 Tax=Grimontia marina TaxID=646534 RepID=A0A128FK43_9GAMM|nr:hypothetical protein [Grimontia marina]CZF87168.1 UDP-glucose:undecaprenyl-phosphate glucose-1-phosphate transferase [Grimontia marina]